MTKIRSTNSVKSKRIHSSYVQRNRVVSQSSSIDPVQPVNPVHNDIGSSSANHLLSSDAFYEKLEELTKEYLNFYHQERNLKKAIDDIEEDMDIDLVYIKELLNKYNRTTKALNKFDQQLNTNHSENIAIILQEYKYDLNQMGIFIHGDNSLYLDEDLFKSNLLESKDNFKKAFNPMRRMILRLYRNFTNIQGPYRDRAEAKYDDFPNRDYTGLVMDKKS